MSWSRGAAVVAVASTLAASAAAATPGGPLVRFGVGIGDVRLGMTTGDARRALGQPLDLVRARRLPDGRRFVEYQSRDGFWGIAMFGHKGRERLVRVSSEIPRLRTSQRLTIGTPMEAVARALEPGRECRSGSAFINYRLQPVAIDSCAVRGRVALTIFRGHSECAVEPIRYQGCPRIRTVMALVVVERLGLEEHRLSVWDPYEPSPILP